MSSLASSFDSFDLHRLVVYTFVGPPRVFTYACRDRTRRPGSRVWEPGSRGLSACRRSHRDRSPGVSLGVAPWTSTASQRRCWEICGRVFRFSTAEDNNTEISRTDMKPSRNRVINSMNWNVVERQDYKCHLKRFILHFVMFFRFSMRYTDHNTHEKKNFVDISYSVKHLEVSLALW